MTKYIIFYISLFLFGCGKDLSNNATNNQIYDSGLITKRQEDLIFEKIKTFPNNTQISIALIEDKKVRFYGAKRENDKIISTENYSNAFEIGSITKIFTSTLLSGLVLENKLALDDNIDDYLNVQLKDGQKITFKELANHTSGLPRLAQNRGFGLFIDSDNPYKDYDEEMLLEYISDKMQLGEKKWVYSNVGAALLGYTLTKIEKRSYQELLDERVFSKYRMNNSTTLRKNIENKLVHGLNKDGNITTNWDMAVHVGAGGIISTAEDLSKFAIAQFDSTNTELGLTRKKTHDIVKGRSVALGWHIIKNENMNEFYAHNGGTGGYTSSINIDMKNQNGVVILSNISSYNEKYLSVIELCTELLQTLKQK